MKAHGVFVGDYVLYDVRRKVARPLGSIPPVMPGNSGYPRLSRGIPHGLEQVYDLVILFGLQGILGLAERGPHQNFRSVPAQLTDSIVLIERSIVIEGLPLPGHEGVGGGGTVGIGGWGVKGIVLQAFSVT
jgi:hypothetical protein